MKSANATPAIAPAGATGLSGHLILIVRTFDAEPAFLMGDCDEAARVAREIVESYVGDSDRPPRARGELGPPGIVSRLSRASVIPFRDGRPVPGESMHFVPER